MSLPSRSVERPVAVVMVFAAIVFLGVISFTRLPIDLLPDVSYPKLVIYTQYPNMAPAEVERAVTSAIEGAVSAVPGRERIESVSREGVSLVTVHFAWGTNMDLAAINVRERLDNLTSLPVQAERPVVLRTDPNAEPIMVVSVAGNNDLWSLKELAEAVFKRRLEQIDGVAQAAVTGGDDREIRVVVDPRVLQPYDLDFREIGQAIAGANASGSGGTIRRDRFRYPLRTLGEFQTVDEIGDVVIRSRSASGGISATPGVTAPGSGGMIRVRDVARVEDGFRERQSLAYYNGEPAVGLLLFKESGANTVRVAEQVEEVLAQLREQYPEIRTDVAMSQAGFITDAISNVVSALVYGGILAFLVLFLFLRDARYPIAISLAIPVSVVATFALLHAFGVSLNIMSLGGLALGVGMLVDNSIVVLENTFRHRELGLPPAAAATVGAEEVQGAITASTLTTISVFGPIVYIEGVAGELFGPVSFAVAFSLLVSLVVALTVLPALAARWGGERDDSAGEGFVRRRVRALGRLMIAPVRAGFGPPLEAFDRWFQRFAVWYHSVLEKALDRRGLVVAGAIAFVGVGALIASILDRAVLPSVDQGAFLVRLELPRGTPLEQTAEVAQAIESVVRADPGVAAVFTRVGRQGAISGLTDDDTGINTALLDVRLREGERTRDVLARVQPRLSIPSSATLSIETGTATSLGRLLGGGEADLAVRVGGEDLDAAIAYASRLQARLATLPELRNVRLGTEVGQPEVRVHVDRERTAAMGVDATAVVDAISMYMGGYVATDFVAFDRRIPVRIELPDETRRSMETLGMLRVDGRPLSEFVHTSEVLAPVEVRRVSQTRVVPIYADAATRDLDASVAAIQAGIRDLPPPPGVRIEIGGENEELRRSFRELAFAFGLAVVLVYMIMAAQFESLVHPFTILLSVPLAVAGAIMALAVTGHGLNSMSLIGIVVLVGIAVNDAIVKVDFINQARRRGVETRQAILDAGRARLRPILMTTVTTVLGLLPMALGIGRGADLRAPLAIAVIGGLISATALTLFVIPVAYDLIDEAMVRVRHWLRRDALAVAATPGATMAGDVWSPPEDRGRGVPAGEGAGGASPSAVGRMPPRKPGSLT